MILLLLLSLQTFAFWPPGQMDPDHDPRYRKPRFIPVNQCRINLSTGKKILLNQGATTAPSYEISLEPILSILEDGRSPPSTRRHAALFRQELRAGTIRVLPLDRRAQNLGEGVMALFYFEIEKNVRIVYFDNTKDQGLVAIFLAHELAHAYDPSLYGDHRRDTAAFHILQQRGREIFTAAATRLHKPVEQITRAQLNERESLQLQLAERQYKAVRDAVIYRAERRAFNEQDLFVRALEGRSDCYRTFLEEHRELNDFRIASLTEDSFIFSRYDIDPQNIRN